MPAEVNQELCDGDAECVSVCPMEIIDLDDEGKAYITDPESCDDCCSCVEVCPTGAITNPEC